MNLYDAHQHFHFDALTPHRATIIHDLAATGVKGAVVNGTNEEEWPVVVALARDYPWIVPSLGLHPWDAGNRSPDWLAKLRTSLRANPAAGVGEIGLDRWLLGLKPDDPRVAGLRVAPARVSRPRFSPRNWPSPPSSTAPPRFTACKPGAPCTMF
jgi:TatD DNase family protein